MSVGFSYVSSLLRKNSTPYNIREESSPKSNIELFMKIIRNLLLVAFTLCAFQQAKADLLSYWNFNNDSPAYSTNLGSFSTTAAAYGETYSQVSTSLSGTLSSNTSNSTVFNGSAIKMDFSNIDTLIINSGTGPTINGKKWSDHTNQEGTGGPAGYGTFTGSTTNAIGSDTAGNSLIFLNPGTSLNGKYITLSLSSLGYGTLSLSYATRLSSAMGSGSEIWTYSTDGTNFTPLAYPCWQHHLAADSDSSDTAGE